MDKECTILSRSLYARMKAEMQHGMKQHFTLGMSVATGIRLGR